MNSRPLIRDSIVWCYKIYAIITIHSFRQPNFENELNQEQIVKRLKRFE